MELKVDVGKIIKMARTEKNLSQEELGKMVGVSKVAVSHWENNKKYPSGDILIKLSMVLKIANKLFPDFEESGDNEMARLKKDVEVLKKQVAKIISK